MNELTEVVSHIVHVRDRHDQRASVLGRLPLTTATLVARPWRRLARLVVVALVVGGLGVQAQWRRPARRPAISAQTTAIHHGVQRGAEVAGAVPFPHPALPAGAVTPSPPPPPVPVPAERPSAPPPSPAVGPYYQQLGAAGLARIGYPWRRLGYALAFEPGRPGLLGMTSCAGRRITVYVRPSEPVAEVAFVTAFEMAHAVDCTSMTAYSRADWARIRGFSGDRPWFPGCTCSEDDFGSGDYAEVFAAWQAGPQFAWRSHLAGPPGGAEMQRLMPYLTGGA